MFREFLADLQAQKLRTALTILGITWGTVAVVVLLAFGVGLEAQTKKRFHGLGERIVLLFGGRTTRAYAGFGEGRYVNVRGVTSEYNAVTSDGETVLANDSGDRRVNLNVIPASQVSQR